MQELKPLRVVLALGVGVPVLLFALGFPDLDIRLLGIGRHRFFLFHSAIIPLLLLAGLTPARGKRTIELAVAAAAAAFALGVGFHLFIDTFQSKAIIFPFIGSLVDGTSLDDRLWSLANALVCGGLAGWLARKALGLVAAGPGPVRQQTAYFAIEPETAAPAVRAFFELYRDNSGEYRFRLKAGNGESILHSEGYTSRAACRKGIEAVRRNAPQAEVFEEM